MVRDGYPLFFSRLPGATKERLGRSKRDAALTLITSTLVELANVTENPECYNALVRFPIEVPKHLDFILPEPGSRCSGLLRPYEDTAMTYWNKRGLIVGGTVTKTCHAASSLLCVARYPKSAP